MGYFDLTFQEKLIGSVIDSINCSVNSADVRNEKLCKSIVYLASAITLYSISQFDYVEEDQLELLEHLHNLAKELNS